MKKYKRPWHSNFIKYMEYIVHQNNYKGLPIERKSNGELAWVATAKSKIGNERKKWALKKAFELGIPNVPGVFAKVMLEVHPTKKKVCQICGKEMSLLYFYPNSHFVKAIRGAFNIDCDETMHMDEIINILQNNHISEKVVKQFIVKKFALDFLSVELEMSKLLKLCESKCRTGNSKMQGPGAMSNFPDRFDGFHTYNRCCRKLTDIGRFDENMKSYTKDRRAYEYWSDGNIHAANEFMGSSHFLNTSADHIGPISLGFIHDPHYLRPMSKGDNSSKRDRLQIEDIKKIIEEEKKTNIYAMSWYSKELWEYIKLNYANSPEKIDDYRNALKQSMATFMLIIWNIINKCKDKGKKFLIDELLIPKMEFFKYKYQFNNLGEIIEKKSRKITESTGKEFERFVRIAFTAVDDYQKKENRQIRPILDNSDVELLNILLKNILSEKSNSDNYKLLMILVKNAQQKLIANLK